MRPLAPLLAAAVIALGVASCSGNVPAHNMANLTPLTPSVSSTAPPSGAGAPTSVTEVARDLSVPWAVAFLPGGSTLVTLRDKAQVVLVAPGRPAQVVGKVPGVEPNGEGGLLGIALSPSFATDHRLFLYLTSRDDNRVVEAVFTGGQLTVGRAVLTGIPKADHHDGGCLAFGPDGFLYVTTGDAGRNGVAQDPGSLGGKILRITPDGRPAPGNPFPGSPVWSYGHRNVQGIGWTKDGTMYASEFGQNTWDELNLIRPGRNYGWPVVEGIAHHQGFVDPLRQWPTDEASPSGIAVVGDTVYLAALRGESLWRVPVHGEQTGEPTRLLSGRYGRLRDVALAPDGRLWVVTSNTFRGNPRPGDDRILAIPLVGPNLGP